MIEIILHRVLIKQDKLEETNPVYQRAAKSGIIIPDHEDNKRAQAGVDVGTVVQIGPTAFKDFNTSSPLKVGDKVAFAKYSGKAITDPSDDEIYIALNDEDIVAIIRS
jgi:co-chaperonin GroES (HSP10)